MATRFYDKKGITTLSNRGTAVKAMCKAVVEAKVPTGTRGRHADLENCTIVAGAIKSGYASWSKKQDKHSPIGYARFCQIVKHFIPLYLKGEDGAFNLINDTDMSYTDACLFGSEAARLLDVAERNGVQVVFKKKSVKR